MSSLGLWGEGKCLAFPASWGNVWGCRKPSLQAPGWSLLWERKEGPCPQERRQSRQSVLRFPGVLIPGQGEQTLGAKFLFLPICPALTLGWRLGLSGTPPRETSSFPQSLWGGPQRVWIIFPYSAFPSPSLSKEQLDKTVLGALWRPHSENTPDCIPRLLLSALGGGHLTLPLGRFPSLLHLLRIGEWGPVPRLIGHPRDSRSLLANMDKESQKPIEISI